MFDRPTGGQAVIIVAIDFGDDGLAESLSELSLLAQGAGLEVRATVMVLAFTSITSPWASPEMNRVTRIRLES